MSESNEPNIFDQYHISKFVINPQNEMKDISYPENEEEIRDLLDMAYEIADKESPMGRRTPFDIQLIETTRTQLERDLRERIREEKESEDYSNKWQNWAERERQKTELSLKIEKMKRLQRALENSEVTDLLLKVMNRKIMPERAFASINSNPDLKNQMMSLTWKGKRIRKGGKSRVFRRKNKTTRSKSRRNAQRTRHTRRHRKSSTRRSTRK